MGWRGGNGERGCPESERFYSNFAAVDIRDRRSDFLAKKPAQQPGVA